MNLVDLFSSQAGTKQSEYGAASTPTTSGNTGVGGVDTILNWIGRGADVYSKVKAADSLADTKSRATPSTAKSNTLANASWLPWAIGGAVLLLVAIIFFRK